MIFSSKQFPLDTQSKQYVVRISNVNPNEMFFISNWDFNARSVIEPNGIGVFGISLPLFAMGFDWFCRILISCCPNTKNIRFILIEIDPKDILTENMNELSFCKGNILMIFNIQEFISFVNKIPQFDNKHIEEMLEMSMKASQYYAHNKYDDWEKQMHRIYEHMYDKLSTSSRDAKKMFDNSKRENNSNRFRVLYNKMKQLQIERQFEFCLDDFMSKIN